MGTETASKISCYHCGEACDNSSIRVQEKTFCCQGCRTVYEIINHSGLCTYYDLEAHPGTSQKTKVRPGKFDFLDNPEIAAKLIHFSDGHQQHVTFYLPLMHCSSCIWLLEHLPKLHAGILSTRVNFLKKEITLVFDTSISLKVIADLLSQIGYEPYLSLNDLGPAKVKHYDKTRLYQLGIAGFCFGNIMLLSFPEYFSSGEMEEAHLKSLFSYLNLALSLPVFFYCASGFFVSAYKGLKQKFLNIDAPIALAILITFARSVYEILSGTGAGYLDSMSGIVFFMLIGRFFQDRGTQALRFDRDYTSYFPIGVTVLQGAEATTKPVSELKKEDRIRVHHNEIIPCDSILFMGKAVIDYSFVTGESLPVEKGIGEIIYAGGRQTGAAIELEVVKEVSQSYLTQLWNNTAFQKEKNSGRSSFTHVLSRYFTYVLFSMAVITGLYWHWHDPQRVWPAVTAMLIVACPCALLLSATFTNGNMLSLLQRRGFFVKTARVLEQMREMDTVIFDKTGTLSLQTEAELQFRGPVPSPYQEQLIRSLASQSGHPLSRAIVSKLTPQPQLKLYHYQETPGQGCSAVVNGLSVKLGSARFVNAPAKNDTHEASAVYISVNNAILGHYTVRNAYRPGLEQVIGRLKQRYELGLLSGDQAAEAETLRRLFGPEAALHFHQQPQQKLDYIQHLQAQGKKVLMVGDGLNDAGALRQSQIGIAISDNINNFSPGSDIIMDGRLFPHLPALLAFCRMERPIIYGSFAISIAYNIVGLSFAAQGHLSPMIAAILMPASSLSIVLFTTLASRFLARRLPLPAIS